LPETRLYRIHRLSNGPWHFSTSGGGRFDLTDGGAVGTCYFAEDPLAAFVEVFRDFIGRPLPRVEIEKRRLFSVRLPQITSLADVTHDHAQAFGVDSSIGASTEADYPFSQAFAAQCRTGGFGGIRYWVRHSLDHRLVGVALFGDQDGVLEQMDEDATSDRIDEALLAEASERYRFRFLGPLLDP